MLLRTADILLRRRCMELDRTKLDSGNVVEEVSLDRSKASSEETLSCGDVNSLRSLEGKDVTSVENLNTQSENRTRIDHQFSHKANDPPTLFRPVACVSAFSVYNPFDGTETPFPISSTGPMQGHPFQASKPDAGISRFHVELLVHHQCGHGCCSSQGEKSLLGPEFVEFLEPQPFSSHEWAAIAKDTSNIAWLGCGLENSSVKATDDAAGRILSHGSVMQLGHYEDGKRSENLRFEEGKYKLLEMMSTPIGWQPRPLPAKFGSSS